MNATTPDRSLSHAVVEATSAADGRDSLDLTPLYEAIDPDALDALFEPTRGGRRRTGKVRFEYCGYTVLVTSDGAVTLTDEPTISDEATISDEPR